MIFLGILLLVIGIICYALARGGHAPSPVGTIGYICSAIGLILLVVGLVIYLTAGGPVEVEGLAALFA